MMRRPSFLSFFLSFRPSVKGVVALAAVMLLSGCASFSSDGGIGDVSAMTSERIGQPVQQASLDQSDTNRQAVRAMLAKPLDADSAVRIALLNNRGLQASLAEFGVAEADLVQAGRLRNPGFSFGRLSGGGDAEIDRGIFFDLAGLLTMPMRSRIESGRFEQAKLQAAADVIALAADVRRAWFDAVASEQRAQLMERSKEAAEAGAELAQQMRQVGNWSRRDAAREQMLYAEAAAQLARDRQTASAAREKLTRLLGLWQSDTAFTLPDRLPELPTQLPAMNDLEARAMTQRLDVQIAKHNAAATADALGLTKATRFINVLDAGYINKSETGRSRSDGYEVSIELPLFDWGEAKTRKAEALYMQSVHRTAETAIRARSEVRESYLAWRTAYDLARHYRDEVLPLRKQVSDDMLRRYNGMLISVFDLLADARLQMQSASASIDAQRNYWLADTDLQTAVNGTGLAGMNSQPASTVSTVSGNQEH